MQTELSIVMLVYKTAHLLTRSLDSIVSSYGYSPQKVEIVVVSDASPDNCDDVIAEYQRAHPGIRYVRREINGGEAKARNSGLENCTGKYVTSVDADDTVDVRYVETLLQVIECHAPDMISFGYRICDAEGTPQQKYHDWMPETLEADVSRSSRRRTFDLFAMNLRFNAVIRRDVIKDQKYEDQYKLGVDMLFNFRAYLKSKKFCAAGMVIHNYHQYGSSLTHNFKPEGILDLLRIHSLCMDELRQQGWYFETADLIFRYFNMNYRSWVLDEILRFGSDTKVAKQFRANYLRVVDDAFAAGAIGKGKNAFYRTCLESNDLSACLALRNRFARADMYDKLVRWCGRKLRELKGWLS